MAFYNYDEGTCKQKRKFKKIKKDNNIRRKQIENIRKLLKENKKDLAKKCIDNYLKEYEENCYILHELGKYYASLSNLKEARECFAKNIENRSINQYYSMYELAKIEKYCGNYIKSLELLYNILDSNHPEKFHAELEIAKVYIAQGRMNDAEKVLKSLADRNTANKIYVLETLVDFYIEKRQLADAFKTLNSIKDAISDIEYQYYEAIIYYRGDRKLEGKEKLQKIINKNSSFKYRAMFELAKLEYSIENFSNVLSLANTLEKEDIFYKFEASRLITSCYIQIGDVEKAKEHLKKMEIGSAYSKYCTTYLKGKLEMKNKNYIEAVKYFNATDINDKVIYRDSVYKLICCYIKLEQFQKAYDLIEKLEELDYSNKYEEHMNSMKIYLCQKLNIDCNIKPCSYFEKQVVKYSSQRAIEHIKKHDNSIKNKHEKTTLFSSNIDIEELYYSIVDKLDETTLFDNTFADEYIISYPNVGEGIDYVRVITIPNTKKIITMYPYDKIYIKNEQSKQKVRQMSRIDKFNKKYGY